MQQKAILRDGLDASDRVLVERARARERTAIAAIMQRYNRRLFRLVRSVLGDETEAEDALQEAYIRAFSALDSFRGESALGTWLSRIALNEALARRRRSRTMQDLDSVAGMATDDSASIIPFPQAAVADPERAAARSEIGALLERAIDSLPEAFRSVFVLRAVEQLSLEETAACLGIPVDTVKTRLHRAKARLREALTDSLSPMLADSFPFAGARCARLTEAVLHRLDLPPDPPPR